MGLYIILMGVQGAGKGMQASFISETYGIPHVSTGDLFRAMKAREDELAKKVQKMMSDGLLIDDQTTNEIVADRLAQPDALNGVILDGYPRNEVQAKFLQDYLQERGQGLSAVLLMNLDLYVAFKRAFGRFTDSDGNSHNIFYLNDEIEYEVQPHPSGEYPPRIVARKLSGGEVLKRRPDDASALAVLKRIDTYLETTMPLVEYFRGEGLVYEINANQDVATVSEDIRKVLATVK